MELRHIRYVVAAAEHGSFRRAAEALGVDQSAVSRRIRDIEDELGAALFVRHHGGVDPTYAGRRFLVRARKVIGQISDAASEVGAAGRGETGILRIGVSSSLVSGFLVELLEAYGDQNPDVYPEIIEEERSGQIHAVRRHQIDVVFLRGHPSALGCDIAHFWSERLFVALRDDDKLAAQSQIAWSDLQARHFIVGETDPWPEFQGYLLCSLGKFNRNPTVERCSVGRETLIQLVGLGRGLSVVSEATTGSIVPRVVYRPLIADELPVSAVWSPRNDNPALRRLLSLARLMSKRRKPLPNLLGAVGR